MGAPVIAYCRIDTRTIRTREPIDAPDVVLVADATLLHHVDVFSGIRPDGYVLVNSAHNPAQLGLDDLVARLPAGHVVSLPATDVARRYLGKPLPNVCLLGALAALTDAVSIDSLESAVHERFAGDVGKANMLAARECYERLEEYVDA